MKPSHVLAAAAFGFAAYPGIHSFHTVNDTYAKIETAMGHTLDDQERRIAARLSWQIAQTNGRAQRNHVFGLEEDRKISRADLANAGISADDKIVQTAISALSLKIDG